MITLAAADLFVLADRKALMIRLPTFEWDFTIGLPVRLRAGARSIRGRQVGTGNHEGKATIVVTPDDWASAEIDLRAMTGQRGSILLEKAEA